MHEVLRTVSWALVLVFVRPSFAAPTTRTATAQGCGSSIEIGPAAEAICQGQVETFTGAGIIDVMNDTGGTTTSIVGISPGDATIYMKNGSVLRVHVSTCAPRLVELRGAAERDGINLEEVAFTCDGTTVVATANGVVDARWDAYFRNLEDRGDFIYRSGRPLPSLQLRVEAVLISRAEVTRRGLNWDDPFGLVRDFVSAIRTGIDGVNGARLYGPTATVQVEKNYDVFVARHIVPESPVKVHLGPKTVLSSGDGASTTLESGISVTLDHIKVLSGNHQVRGDLTVTYQTKTGGSTTSKTMSIDESGVDYAAGIRLPLNRVVEVASWSPDHHMRANRTLPLLTHVDPLNAVLGGWEDAHTDLVLHIQMMLQVDRGNTDISRMDELNAQGDRWLKEM